MGVGVIDVGGPVDLRPAGGRDDDLSIHSRLLIATTPAHRATLRAAADGTDAEVRAALVSVGGVPAGVLWDALPGIEAAIVAVSPPGHVPAGYVSGRSRIRTWCASLP